MTDKAELHDEVARLRALNRLLFNALARITYCSAQCGDDAVKMREIAWAIVYPPEAKS